MKYIVANWKMKMNLGEVEKWLETFVPVETENTIIVAPSTPYLFAIKQAQSKLQIACAGQDISEKEKGAHTGDVGVFQLADFAKYCIVGHSERKELKEDVFAKRDACLAQGITPIVCFTNPQEIASFYKEGALLAWEDPENISKDGIYNQKNPEEIAQNFVKMKNQIPESKILYGGSVNKDNILDLTKITQIDGVLVGNASMDSTHFKFLIEAFQ